MYVISGVPLRSTLRKTTMDMQMQSQEKQLKEGHVRKSKMGNRQGLKHPMQYGKNRKGYYEVSTE